MHTTCHRCDSAVQRLTITMCFAVHSLHLRSASSKTLHMCSATPKFMFKHDQISLRQIAVSTATSFSLGRHILYGITVIQGRGRALRVLYYYPNMTTLRPGLCLQILYRPSVVCNVRAPYRPTQGVETFGNISSPFCTIAIII